jgi:HK97 family phage prohead protease
MTDHHLKSTLATRHAPALELKFAAAEGNVVTGYGAVFGNVDSHGDVIMPGAFARTLAEHKSEGTLPAMLWAHDMAAPIGHWTEMREDRTGLFVRGVLNLQASKGADAHAHIRAGDLNGLSIGYFVGRNGERPGAKAGTTELVDVDLLEVSVVALPSNRRARLHLESKRELEELLIKSGLPKAAAVRLAAGGWPALVGGAGEDHSDTLNLKRAAARIEALAEAMRNGT